MRRDDFVDYFIVEEGHLAMHSRLENWSRTVEVWRTTGRQHPMWAKSSSNSRQWHEPELRLPTNTLDGHVIEKAVAALPVKHRDALRWSYVYKGGPLNMARKLGVSKQGLMDLVRIGRQMLINRKV